MAVSQPVAGDSRTKQEEVDAHNPACQLFSMDDAIALMGEDVEQQDRDGEGEILPASGDLGVDACHYYAKRERRRTTLVRYTPLTDTGRAL